MTQETHPKGKRGRPPRDVQSSRETRHWRVQCKAKSKSTEKRCTRPAMRGQQVCYQHGGAAPQNRAKGERVFAQYQAKAHAARLMHDLAYKAENGIKDPLDALERLAVEIMANKDALGSMVNNLQGQIEISNNFGDEKIRGVLELYNSALDRTMKVLDALLKHDIEGKKIKIVQDQAQAVAALVMRVLIGSGLTGPALMKAKTELSSGLKELTVVEGDV